MFGALTNRIIFYSNFLNGKGMNDFFRWRNISAKYCDGFSWHCLEEKTGTNYFLYKLLNVHSNSTKLNVVHFIVKLVLICLTYRIGNDFGGFFL